MMMDLMYSEIPPLSRMGKITVTVDAKGRVGLPVKIREWVSKYADGELTLDPNKATGILEVWAASAFDKEQMRQMENVGQDKIARRKKAHTFMNACDLKMDASGRIRISSEMRDDLRLEGKVKVSAVFDHFIIFHPDNDPDLTDVTS
jgi:division/cell wall cluster transcriptional repressor MraZ